jgi:hypothetical protein
MNRKLVFDYFHHNEYQKMSPFLHHNERIEMDRKVFFESFNHNEYQKVSPFLLQNERIEMDRKVQEIMLQISQMPKIVAEEKMMP